MSADRPAGDGRPASDDELLRHLGDALDRPVPPAPPARVAAVREAAERARAAGESAGGTSRRTWLLSSAAAAAGVVGGVAVGAAFQGDGDDQPVTGPPTEPMTWAAEDAASGLTLAGRTINHTWGVELLLDATGFVVDAPYRIVFVGADGQRTEAGGFVGSVKPMICRCNAPVLREAVATMEILAGEVVVARGTFG